MKYLLMAYVNEGGFAALTPEQREQGAAAYMAYGEALAKAGVAAGSNRLQPSTAATTVRVANGKSQVLDGPYADSKEQLGGYYLIDVADHTMVSGASAPYIFAAPSQSRGASVRDASI